MLHWGRMNRKGLSLIFLICGLAFVFVWFGIDKLVHPTIWSGFLPLWMDGFLGYPNTAWILVIGCLEILFAILILIPVRHVRQAGAAIICLHLAGIIWQVGWNDIGVRDIGLFMSSVALLCLL